MEPAQINAISAISSAILTGGYYSWKCYKNLKKKKLIFGILVSESCGLTDALKKIDINENLIAVDIGEIIKIDNVFYEKLNLSRNTDYYNVLLFEYVKNYLERLRKINKKKIIVILTSNKNLLDYLKIDNNSISVFIPTIDYSVELIKKFTDENDIERFQRTREKLTELKYPIFKFKNHTRFKEHLEALLNPKS
jgi:hypothetical protein